MRRPSSCMDPPGLAATGGKPGQSQNPDTDYLTSRKRTLPKPHEYGDPIIVLPRWPGFHLVSKPRSLDALVCARGQLPVRCSYLARAAVVFTRRLRARTSHRCPWVWRTPSGSSKSIRRCRSGAPGRRLRPITPRSSGIRWLNVGHAWPVPLARQDARVPGSGWIPMAPQVRKGWGIRRMHSVGTLCPACSRERITSASFGLVPCLILCRRRLTSSHQLKGVG